MRPKLLIFNFLNQNCLFSGIYVRFVKFWCTIWLCFEKFYFAELFPQGLPNLAPENPKKAAPSYKFTSTQVFKLICNFKKNNLLNIFIFVQWISYCRSIKNWKKCQNWHNLVGLEKCPAHFFVDHRPIFIVHSCRDRC